MNLINLADLLQFLLLALSSARSSVSPGRLEKKCIKFLKLRTRYARNQQRRLTAQGLSLVLAPERSPQQREEILISRYQGGLVNMEIVWLRTMVRFRSERKAVCSQVLIEGREHLNEALGCGKGVVLIQSPFGKRLMGSLVLAEEGYPVSQVHGRGHGGSSSWLGRKVIRKLHRKWESRLFSDILEIDNRSLAYLRPIIQRLKQNRVVYMPGMAGGASRYLPVEFLGAPAKKMFPTGVASLARTTGAALIPFFCYRHSDGSDRLKIEKPIDVRREGRTDEDLQFALRKYAHLVESYVLKYPSQFMRWHLGRAAGRSSAKLYDLRLHVEAEHAQLFRMVSNGRRVEVGDGGSRTEPDNGGAGLGWALPVVRLHGDRRDHAVRSGDRRIRCRALPVERVRRPHVRLPRVGCTAPREGRDLR